MSGLVGYASDVRLPSGDPLGDVVSVLLFAAEPLASEVAWALRQHVTPHVEIAANKILCSEALRRASFDLVLAEESVALVDPAAADVLYEAAGNAVIVEVNFGMMDAESVVRQTKSALRRRKRDLLVAESAARSAFQRELMVSLTGLLLESQLALRQADAHLAPALNRLVGLAEHVCAQLRGEDAALR